MATGHAGRPVGVRRVTLQAKEGAELAGRWVAGVKNRGGVRLAHQTEYAQLVREVRAPGLDLNREGRKSSLLRGLTITHSVGCAILVSLSESLVPSAGGIAAA